MAVKTIAYTVDSTGISPKVRLDGGVQGDHRITDLEFTVAGGLYEKLKTKAATLENGKIYYRFDMYNGEGDFESTQPQLLESDILVFPLEEWITRYGGIIKVLLVFTVGDSTETLQELYSFPAILSLKSRPTGSEPSDKNYQSMTLMSVETTKAAKQAAEDAASAASSAVTAKDYAERLVDAEVIFKSDLDDEGQPIPFGLVVDDHLSSESQNPVQNKVLTAALNNIKVEVDTTLSDNSENPIANKAVTAKLNELENNLSKSEENFKATYGIDYVVDQGTNGIWTYRKWASGIAECWAQITVPYFNVSMLAVDVDFANIAGFVDTTDVQVSGISGMENYWAICAYSKHSSVQYSVYVTKSTQGTFIESNSAVVSVNAKGRWE